MHQLFREQNFKFPDKKSFKNVDEKSKNAHIFSECLDPLVSKLPAPILLQKKPAVDIPIAVWFICSD